MMDPPLRHRMLLMAGVELRGHPHPGQRYKHGWIPVVDTVTSAGTKLSVTHAIQPYPGETDPMNYWAAEDETGQVVGELWAHLATGQIMQVHTAPHRRREGIATALYEVASKQAPIFHSPSEHRTPEGHGWAKAVGGDDIPDDLAYQP